MIWKEKTLKLQSCSFDFFSFFQTHNSKIENLHYFHLQSFPRTTWGFVLGNQLLDPLRPQ